MSEIKYLDYEGLEELVSLLDSRRTADNLAVTLALNQINEDIGNINIGNGTLTITRNNESLGTFTANQSSNATIDIDVPESISDFGNDGVQEILNIIKYGLPDVSELTEELKAALEATHNYAKASQLADYGKSIAYDSGNKKIQLKNGNTVLSEISAADFLVDGMIEDVKIAKGTGANINKDCLIFDFNTDSGITDIEIPIDSIFNANNYYTKNEIDALVPDAQIQSDWNLNNSSAVDYIKNKPTNVSAFTNDAGYLTLHQDISGKANSADLATVATTGDYDDLTNKPSIPTVPTNVSSFTNDAGYITDISGKADDSVVVKSIKIGVSGTPVTPVNGVVTLPENSGGEANVLSDWNLTDTAADDYIKNKPTNVSDFTNDAGYLTSHQDISGKANSADLAAVATSGSYNDLSNKPTIPSLSGYATETYVNNKFKDVLGVNADGVSALKALTEDSDAATGLLSAIGSKVDKVAGKGLSSEDYTTTEKNKLAGIESGAQAHKAPTSSEITTALGYTPYNSTNPNGYTSNTGTVTQVKVGTTAYNPSSGVVSLPAYPSVPTKVSLLTNDSGYTTNTGTITKVGNTSSGAVTVSSSNNTASWGGAVTVGSVGGVDLKFKMPGNPNTNTWKAATTSQEGYVPTLALSGTTAGAKKDTVNTQANDYVLTYTNGTESAPVWRKLPSTAYSDNNTTYSFSNKAATLAWGTPVTIATVGGVDITAKLPSNPNTDTNTHWTTRLYAGESGTAANKAVTSPYVKITDDNTYRNQIRLIGGGATKVTSDDSGNITITSTDTNTHAVSSVAGNTGAVTAAQIATALTGAGYKLTDTDTNTWRPVQCNSTDIGSNTLNIVAGSNVTLSRDGGKITISSTDTNTTYSKLSQFTNDSGYIKGITKSMVTTALGYTPPTSDTNTVTSINGKTGAIAAADMAAVLTAAGYKLTDTDTNTWRPVGTGASDAAAGNHTHGISLATDSGKNQITLAHGTKYKLTAGGQSVIFTMPTDNNTTYSFSDKNVTLAWGTKSTIATVGGTDIHVTMPANPNTNTTYSAGTGLGLSGTTFSVKYGTAAGTACQGNDSRLSNSRPASDVYSWAKASSKPSYTLAEVGASMSATTIKSNTSSTCSITGSGNAGKSQTIVYVNGGSSNLTVTVPTTYKTPKNAAIEVKCPAGGYCEVNYLNIGGTIYARAA